MALLFMDGFDNYNFLRLKWAEDTRRSTFSIADGIGRNGAAGLKVFGDSTWFGHDHLGLIFENNLDHLIFGFAFRKVKADPGFLRITLNDGETIQNRFDFFSTGVTWSLGDSTSETSIKSCLVFNEWNYIEIKVKLHPTAGEIIIRVGEHEILSLTNINTIITANSYADRLRMQNYRASDTDEDFAYIDDIYLCDTTGTINNDFLGNCEVNSYYPISQGSKSDFLLPPTVSGVDNYTMIDERQVNNTTQIEDTLYIYAKGDEGCSTEHRGWEYSSYDNYLMIEKEYYNETDNNFFIRFSNINIPRHAKIISCKLDGYVDQHQTDASIYQWCTIGFQNTADGVVSPTSNSDILSRSMSYCAGNYNVMKDDLTGKPTNIEMKNYLQELVSRNNWVEVDNSILYLVKNYYGSYSGSADPINDAAFRFRSYDFAENYASGYSPRLNITYEIHSESPSDDYIKSENLNTSETYNITVSGLGDVFGVSTSVIAKTALNRANPNDMSLTNIAVIGGTTYSGTTKTPYDYYYTTDQLIFEQNPATSSTWTQEDLSNAEFGFTTISG